MKYGYIIQFSGGEQDFSFGKVWSMAQLKFLVKNTFVLLLLLFLFSLFGIYHSAASAGGFSTHNFHFRLKGQKALFSSTSK